jgi:hypothetical protein
MTVREFSDVLDKYKVIHRLMLLFACFMTTKAYLWGVWFATGNARDGVEIAAIIAAVTAPVTLLATSVYGNYVAKGRV